MGIEIGKTDEGPVGSEWNMTVLLIDNGEAICLPSRPSGDDERPILIKSEPGRCWVPAIERIPMRQLVDWAVRCISEPALPGGL